jgi:serine/threonine protein kinase
MGLNSVNYQKEKTYEGSLNPFSPGECILSGYRVIQHLRRGNYYDVYQLWSEERLSGCIGKTPRPDCKDNQVAISRLFNEGEKLKQLSHPNLVRGYEIFYEPQPLAIQETLTGQTLYFLIKNNNIPLSYKEISHLGIQLCSVIQYLHNNNILHLDLNPTNIICQPPFVKVIDLSISREPGFSKKGEGSKQFMAPEQAKGESVSTATDVWGIGVVLYNAVTGKIPFKAYEGDRYEQLELKILPIHPLRKMPANLIDLISKCLERNPVDRPRIVDIISELNTLIEQHN